MNFKKYKPTYEDFLSIVKEYKEKYTWTYPVFNLEVKEKKNGNHNVHIHGMIKSPKKVNRRMLDSCLMLGFNLTDHSYVRSKAAWKCYMSKSTQGRETLQRLLPTYLSPEESERKIMKALKIHRIV